MHKIILSLAALTFLSGCSVQSETWVNKAGRVEIREDHFTDTFETTKINKSIIHAIGDYYDRYGNGPMSVVVSYDPQSKVNSKQNAQNYLEAITNQLSKVGISDLNGTISEMRGSGDLSTTLVSFPATIATAPKGCGFMPGYEDPSEEIPDDTNIKAPYGYGCTIENLMAKQISRPSDLLGKQAFETNSDGRRTERVISGRGYYSDKEFPKLEGESASEK
jgi:type IV pilus biogenesis protein CpaD/CtpE